MSPYLFIMVMSVLFTDVDVRLRSSGVPTNTWSVGKPIYDLEYADDTLLLALSRTQSQEFLKHVQVEATLYGLSLNLTKTEALTHPQTEYSAITFSDGTQVPEAGQVKYLGALISWTQPVKIAIEDRKRKAHIAYLKLQHLWRSKLNCRKKVRIFMASMVPVLTYGLATLSLEKRHTQSLDAWFLRYLRRCMGIKHSYYSHVTNDRVYKLAGYPALPSHSILQQQFKMLAKATLAPTNDPIHHVIYSPGYKDRIKFTKSARRGHPSRYWFDMTSKHAVVYLNHYLDHSADPELQESRRDFLGVKHLLQRSPQFRVCLETAPTRNPELFKISSRTLSSARQP